MSQSNNTTNAPRDPFEAQLSSLLARTANDLRPAAGFARQVRRRALAGDFSRSAPSARFTFRFTLPSLKPLGSVALVTLVVGALVWLLAGPGIKGLHFSPVGAQPGGSSSTQNCDNSYMANRTPPNGPKPLDNSVAIGASASAHGITYTLDRAYADATQTLLTFHATMPSNLVISYDTAIVTDASGTIYAEVSGATPYGAPQDASQPGYAAVIFAPLPQSELGTPQHLTLTFSHLEVMPPTAPPPGTSAKGTAYAGVWVIPFTITPVAGTAIPLSLPAQTHDGITIQPEEMDVAPAGGGLDGLDGGVRVRFRMSNLPPNMLMYAVSHFSFFFQSGAGGGSMGYACGDTLTLRLPSGKAIIPGILVAPALYTPVSDAPAELAKMGAQTVGASGSAEVEALFFTPIQPGAGALKLTFDHIQIIEARSGQPGATRVAQGPWAFDIPLRP